MKSVRTHFNTFSFLVLRLAGGQAPNRSDGVYVSHNKPVEEILSYCRLIMVSY